MTSPDPFANKPSPSTAAASKAVKPPAPETVDSDGATIRDLEELLLRGREILAVCGWNGKSYDAFRPGGIWVLKFRAQAMAFVEQALGATATETRTLHDWIDDPRAIDRGYYVPEILGVLQDVYGERCRERVFQASPMLLVAIEDDVIEVAETLSNAGELIPGARRAGVVLQRLLGRLGRHHELIGEEPVDAESINRALLEEGIFCTTTHLKVGAYLQIARDLPGPRQGEIPPGELREMVRWVSDLTRKHRA